MKIFITGTSGFIGFSLAKALLDKGHKVYGIDDHNNYYDVSLKEERNRLLKHQNFSFELTSLSKINFKQKFDLAINLAAQPGVRLRQDKHHLYEHSNIKGFESFCNFCLNNNIDRVIYASSSSVYSDEGGGKFSENSSKLDPKSLYGKSKLANEIFAQQFSEEHNISFVGLRFFSVYGPWGRPDMAYFSFADSITKGMPITLYNKGKMARDMTYIDDIISGVSAAIDFQFSDNNKISKIFNLGNDYPIETINLLRTLEEKLGKKALIKHKQSINESLYTHADLQNAKNQLGYSPKMSFNDGIDQFLDWYKHYGKR